MVMAKIYPSESDKPMVGAEFKRIRLKILKKTQVELKSIIHRGIDRISAWENDRADIPPLIAAHMRSNAEKSPWTRTAT